MSTALIALAAAALLRVHAGAQTHDPAAEARRAQELTAAGKMDEAIDIYRDLVRRSPGNPTLLLNLSITEYKARQFANSATHASAALQLQPDLLPARLFLGASQLELGQFARAAEALSMMVGANPQDRNARLMLGEALLALGKPAVAVTHLEAAAEQLPANPRLWYGLGRGYEALGRSEAALEAWKKLQSLPRSVESHMHAAQVHDKEQRWREAASEWRLALNLSPANRTVVSSLANSLFRSRDYDAAMAALKPLLENPDAEVEFLYGASLLNVQQPGAAIPYLRAAIAHATTMLPARAALGQALLQTGKAEEAIPLLKDAAPADTDGSVHFQLYRAYQLTHREAEAREALAAYQRLRTSLPATR